MSIIGRQCTRDFKTVCLAMSEATLPVNQSGPGLSLVYGWSSEEHRAQGVMPAIQGIDFGTAYGKVLPLEYCPWCGGKLAWSLTRVRTDTASAEPVAHRAEALPSADAGSAAEPKRDAGSEPKRDARNAEPGAAPSSESLRAIRERLGLSQAELGMKLGMTERSVDNYECGRAPLSMRLRKWMARNAK